MQKAKDLPDRIRGILWYEHLCTYLNLRDATPHQIEAEIKKRLYGRYVRPTGGWGKFQIGERTPRPAFAVLVERIVPRSRYIVDHPLWTALRNDFDVQQHAVKLLQALPPKMRYLVFSRQNDSRKKVTHGLLNNLDKHLGRGEELSVLACFVVFLREAHAQGNTETTDLVGGHIHDALLLLLGAGLFQSVAEQLLEIFRTRILSLTKRGGRIIIHYPDFFLEAVKTLQRELMLDERISGKFFSVEEKINFSRRYMYKDAGVHGQQSIFWQIIMGRLQLTAV